MPTVLCGPHLLMWEQEICIVLSTERLPVTLTTQSNMVAYGFP